MKPHNTLLLIEITFKLLIKYMKYSYLIADVL